ncbi:lactate racemase domain-containing protein [Paenibacillus ginsengihumi]|uniref:lactate racemase domain-containing protein n=1 Tax=Paenibacillus ginsengihumi TaxID=431596 RepID=UPI00037B5965|nr:lactate racemase domain-containing protein [Paenibacillus ginsengihumi]
MPGEAIRTKINPGQRVAVAVGSRGIANIKEIVACVVSEVKKLGGEPFIVPAMGSHGGATDEGQAEVLAHYGITESAVGAPIVSSMETVQVGRTPGGIPLFFDKNAFMADAVVLVARVKPHTDFKGPVESGLLKMMAIGLGKHKGAETLHSQGFEVFDILIPEAGQMIARNTPVKLGVAIIENAYEETAQIHVVPVEQFYEKECEFLVEAKQNMPRLNVDRIDVLIIDEVGKDISGAGMDPNITGRFSIPVKSLNAPPPIQRMAFTSNLYIRNLYRWISSE